MVDIKLSVAIMTHISRQDQLSNLISQIGNQIEYEVFVDDGSYGLWENAKRAWRSYKPDSTHHMVLQDDVFLSKNFFKVAKKLIAYVNPGDSVSFCDSLTAEFDLASRNNYHWVSTTKVRHAQCLVQPVGQIENWIKFSDWFVRPEYDHDDGRLEIYLQKHKIAIWHSVPSLVEHDDKGSVGGLPGDQPYIGYKFIGQNTEADPKEWSNLHIGLQPSTLRISEKWAIGEIKQVEPSDFPGHELFSKPTSGLTYEDVIVQARIDRGATEPYEMPVPKYSVALLKNPCKDGEPCN